MNEAEKERLIKKDIKSIENRVRSAFNQGYEMGLKENKEQGGDAISRKYILDLIATKGANLDDDLLIVEQWIQDAPSVNPHPIECGDAISRQAVMNAITMAEVRWQAVDNVNKLPSVTPQQRIGRWIKDEHENGVPYIWVCSNCGTYHRFLYDYCPSCGAKMEVE